MVLRCHHRPLTETIDQSRRELLISDEFRHLVAHRLSEAVRVPTITYDNMGHVGTDPRWDIFFTFLEMLKKTFPRMQVGTMLCTLTC